MARRVRPMTGDSDTDELMSRFDYAYIEAFPHFERMERIQQSYDNKINEYQWPTISEIAMPLTFVGVEEQLPFAMKYCFPKRRFIKLMPEARAMDTETVRLVESDLTYTLRTAMDLEVAMLPSVKDCYKFAVGYGLIDVQVITPPDVVTNEMYAGGKLMAKRKVMALGAPRLAITYRYVPPICVIPMPDGANVERPNKASGHFVIDLIYEDDFRAMYEDGPVKSMMNLELQGNPDDIIKDARNMNLDARLPTPDIIHALSGIDLQKTNTGQKEMPVVIPVVRCYFDNWQCWIANGRTKIWKKTNTFQTMRSDLVKFSAWPDGNRWFPLGVTEASEKLSLGVNIWYNGLVDLAMYSMNPTRVINESMLSPSETLKRGPRTDIKVTGDARQAIQFMPTPTIDGELFTMGGLLSQMHGKVNAQPSFMDTGAPGLVRGGTNALETMLGSSTGRQLLAAIVIKSGGMKPTVEKTLIRKQLLVDEQGDRFIDQVYDPESGREQHVEKTVTLDDLRNVWRVELDMPAARLNSASQYAERAAYFDRAERHSELFDQRSLYEELADDEALVRRTMLPRAVVKEREEAMARARITAAARGGAPGGGGPPPTEGQQALAGAANLGGAL